MRDCTKVIQVRLAPLLLMLAVPRVHGSSCLLTSQFAVCNHQGIVRIPGSLPDTITNFNLNQNEIEAIRREDLERYRRLQELLISSNRLRTLDEDAFAALGDLTDVDLSFNLITNINKFTFSQNVKLYSVNLRENKLRLDPSSPLLVSSSIELLDLTSCGIQQVSNVTFSWMKKLKRLEMYGNKILRLDPESFSRDSFQTVYIDPAEEIKSSLSKLCRGGVKVYHSENVEYCEIARETTARKVTTTSHQEPESTTSNVKATSATQTSAAGDPLQPILTGITLVVIFAGLVILLLLHLLYICRKLNIQKRKGYSAPITDWNRSDAARTPGSDMILVASHNPPQGPPNQLRRSILTYDDYEQVSDHRAIASSHLRTPPPQYCQVMDSPAGLTDGPGGQPLVSSSNAPQGPPNQLRRSVLTYNDYEELPDHRAQVSSHLRSQGNPSVLVEV